jgi:hypothetical protein
MKRLCTAVAVLMVVGTLRAQQWGPAELRFPMLDRVPLSLGMPYDVLLGYVALDSIYYWLRERAYWSDSTPYWRTNRERMRQVVDFLRRRTQWDDTLRKIVRTLYAMCDYDPILFARTLRMNPPYQPWYRNLGSGNFPQPDEFLEMLLGIRYDDFDMGRERSGFRRYSMRFWDAYGQDTLNRIRDLLLLQPFYIAHIKVVDTMSVDWGQPRFVVTAQVLDLIKGQQLMPCDPRWMHPRLEGAGGGSAERERVFQPWLRSALDGGLERREQSPMAYLSGSTPCLQFCATPQPYGEFWWSYDIWLGDRSFGDTIQIGREYLVFLTFSFWEFYPDGKVSPRALPDSLQLVLVPAFTFPPLPATPPPPPREWGGEYEYDKYGRALFPIEYRDGEAVVRMPENDLWLGQEVPLEWFKNWLRERIAEYRSW